MGTAIGAYVLPVVTSKAAGDNSVQSPPCVVWGGGVGGVAWRGAID